MASPVAFLALQKEFLKFSGHFFFHQKNNDSKIINNNNITMVSTF